MSRSVKGLIAGIVVLILLIGAAIYLSVTKPAETTENITTSKLAYEKSYNDLSTLYYKNQYGELHLNKNSDGSWSAEEFPDAQLDDDFLLILCRAVSKVTLRGIIEENSQDITQYGLDDPVIEVKAGFSDSSGTVKEFKIGAPLLTEGRSYFALNGDSNVYWIMDVDFNSLTYHPYSIINRVLLPESSENSEPSKIEYVNVKRADLPYEMEAVLDNDADDKVTSTAVSTHKLSKPIEVQLEPYNASSFIKSLFGLKASNVVSVNITEEELERAGIYIKPDGDKMSVCTVEMKAGENVYRLFLGDPISEGSDQISGYFEGVNILFAFNRDDLPWLTQDPTDISDPVLISYGIYDAAKLEVISGNSRSVFELSGDDAETFKAVLNGKETDKEYFRTFYSFLLSVSADEVYLNEPESSEPDATVILTRRKGGNEEIRLDFYDCGDRSAIVVQNGKPIYKCRMAFVEKLRENIHLLESEGELLSIW